MFFRSKLKNIPKHTQKQTYLEIAQQIKYDLALPLTELKKCLCALLVRIAGRASIMKAEVNTSLQLQTYIC